jgi:hypothetical protein
MNKSDEYLAYATECTQWAVQAKTEDERKAFVEMAQHWMQAALRIEEPLNPQKNEPPPFGNCGSDADWNRC